MPNPAPLPSLCLSLPLPRPAPDDVWFNEQWANLGYLAIFIAVFLLFAAYSINRTRHIVR